MSRLGGFVRITRPVNCFMMGMAIIAGAVIGGGTSALTSLREVVLAFVTGFTLTGSAMSINDYYDRDIDAVNEPGRPIPSGAVKPREALAFSIVLSVAGLVAAWMTCFGCLLIAVFAWVVAMSYATRGKRTGFPGNLMVSTCISLPFVYGELLVTGSVLGTALLFSLLAFLSNTGREIAKGIVDVEGDGVEGMRTIAVSRGTGTAAMAASAFFLSSVFASILPLYLGLVSWWYIPFVALTDLGLVYSSFSLIRDYGRENSRRVKNRVLLLMLSGLVGFSLGSLT